MASKYRACQTVIVPVKWGDEIEPFFGTLEVRSMGDDYVEKDQQANDDEQKRGRKEAKQISFRVSEGEYLKLEQSAETLNMSVPAFVKKKAQGAKLATPKFEKETGVQLSRELRDIGKNVNQIARWCNQRQEEALQEKDIDRLEENVQRVQEELNRIWQRLS